MSCRLQVTGYRVGSIRPSHHAGEVRGGGPAIASPALKRLRIDAWRSRCSRRCRRSGLLFLAIGYWLLAIGPCMEPFYDILRKYPELAIFLTLAIGFYIGRLKVGGFSIGSVTGVLLTGLVNRATRHSNLAGD